MFNVEGQCYITNLKEVSPKLLVGDVYAHKKIADDKFETTFLKAKIVSEAMTFIFANGIKNKDKIYIESSVLGSITYTNKEGKEIKQTELTIFKLCLIGKNDDKDDKKSQFER